MISCYYRYPAKCARANEKIAIFGERYTHKNWQHTQPNGSPCLKAEAIKLCSSGILFRKIRGLKGNMSLKICLAQRLFCEKWLCHIKCVWRWGRGEGKGGRGAQEYGVGHGIYIYQIYSRGFYFITRLLKQISVRDMCLPVAVEEMAEMYELLPICFLFLFSTK